MTEKKASKATTSHALILAAKGIIAKLPSSRAMHPILTSTYKIRKYPIIRRILPSIRSTVEFIQKQNLVQEQCDKPIDTQCL